MDMKLRKFDIKSLKTRPSGKATVRVAKNGTFTFNTTFCQIADLKEGVKVNILQDEDHPSDWYIQLTDDEFGIAARRYKSNSVIVACSQAARSLFNSVNVQEYSVQFLMATRPVDDGLYAIITRSAPAPAVNYAAASQAMTPAAPTQPVKRRIP